MDRVEAKQVLTRKMDDYQKFSYRDLANATSTDEYFEIAGSSGTSYQIEVQIRWDDGMKRFIQRKL